MQDIKQNLANAVREARTELGLSQEKLAEILNLDQRTILNIEAGRGNPKFEKLYPLITYLKIPADKIFYPDSNDQKPNLQKLLTLIMIARNRKQMICYLWFVICLNYCENKISNGVQGVQTRLKRKDRFESK